MRGGTPGTGGHRPIERGGGGGQAPGSAALGDPAGALGHAGSPLPGARQLAMAMEGGDRGVSIPDVLRSYEQIAFAADPNGRKVPIRFGRFLQQAEGFST